MRHTAALISHAYNACLCGSLTIFMALQVCMSDPFASLYEGMEKLLDFCVLHLCSVAALHFSEIQWIKPTGRLTFCTLDLGTFKVPQS
jgi:hypothetical protein